MSSITTPSATAGEVVRIQAQSTRTAGRYLVSARHNVLPTDARTTNGGTGLAIAAGELLLSSLASCSFGLIQEQARERKWPLHALDAEVLFERDPVDSTRYARLELHITAIGVTQQQAQILLDYFTGKCPIYNTLRRGGPANAQIVGVESEGP